MDMSQDPLGDCAYGPAFLDLTMLDTPFRTMVRLPLRVPLRPAGSFAGIKWPTFEFEAPAAPVESNAKPALPALSVLADTHYRAGPGWRA